MEKQYFLNTERGETRRLVVVGREIFQMRKEVDGKWPQNHASQSWAKRYAVGLRKRTQGFLKGLDSFN